MKDYYLSICAIFRNEACYLDEWIQFHKSNGVEHFFLYDHLSSDNPRQILSPYINSGMVTIIDWPIKTKWKAQPQAYQHCLDNFGQSSRWIAFIDLDEFLFSPCNMLNKVLKGYESYCGVVAYWQCYGSSGHIKCPEGLVTNNYLYRAERNWIRNKRVKSIVNPDLAIHPLGPHFFIYRNNASAVDEKKQQITVRNIGKAGKLIKFVKENIDKLMGTISVDPYANNRIINRCPSVDVIRINHYSVKSWEEFEQKIAKSNKKKYDRKFFEFHDRNEVYDPILKGSTMIK